MSYHVKSGLVSGIPPKRFRPGGKRHYYVRVWVEADTADEMAAVASVIYQLHPTFRERLRTSSDKSRQFEITFWTYGFFEITAVLFFPAGTTPSTSVTGYVSWQHDAALSGPEPQPKG